MYSECASLTDTIQECVLPKIVLSSFPESVGRDVVRSVLPPLAGRGSEEEDSGRLQTREEVEWTMQVLGYGLQLPLSEHELVNSCVAVYEEWLSAFSSSPSPSVPARVPRASRLLVETCRPFITFGAVELWYNLCYSTKTLQKLSGCVLNEFTLLNVGPVSSSAVGGITVVDKRALHGSG